MYLNNTTFSNVPDYLPPHNLDAEESVLGGLMLDPDAYERVKDILTRDAFYLKQHQEIYRAICKLQEQKQVTDLMTVTSYLIEHKRMEATSVPVKLAQLIDRCVSAVNIDHHARLLVDKLVRRQAMKLSEAVKEVACTSTEAIGLLLQRIEQLTMKVTRSQHRYQSAYECAIAQCDQLIEEVRRIELEVDRPDHREFLLQELAARHGRRDVNAFKNLYYKSLIAEDNEPSMTLKEAFVKYGHDVNKWLQHGILPAAKTVLLHGDSGANKTTFAYNLVFHLATGTHWGNFSVTAHSRRCLIVQTDETPSDTLRKLANRGIEEGMPVRLKTKWSVDHMQHLRREIIEHGAEFVVIDSLTSVSRNSLISENDAEYARPILALRDIAAETGATILILHHDSKEGTARGTSAIKASVSEVLHITRDPKDNDLDSTTRFLLFEKSRSRTLGGIRIEIDTDNFSLTCHGDVKEQGVEKMSTKQAIVQHLRDHPEEKFEAKEFEQWINAAYNHIRSTLKDLAEQGTINRERKFKNSAYRYYLSFENLADLTPAKSSDEVSKRVSEESPSAKEFDGATDPRSAKNTSQDERNKELNGKKQGSEDQSVDKSAQEKEYAAAPATDPDSKQTNFFNEYKSEGSVDLWQEGFVGSRVETNYTNECSHINATLAKYKEGDRVQYTGDRPILQNRIYEVIKAEKETWCSYSYICRDVNPDKQGTVRIQENELSNAEQNQ